MDQTKRREYIREACSSVLVSTQGLLTLSVAFVFIAVVACGNFNRKKKREKDGQELNKVRKKYIVHLPSYTSFQQKQFQDILIL